MSQHRGRRPPRTRTDREAILISLQERQATTSLAGNRRRPALPVAPRQGVRINSEKVKRHELYDGKWVQRTTAAIEPADVTLAYKQL